jgi:FKBP-type peptidyl-prolyl cis-trans isomerase SlyD
MHVQAETVVAIDYVLKNDAGEIIDQSEPGDPLFYLHGHGNIVDGLEERLDGSNVGDHIEVVVPPEKGYGVVDDARVQEIPRSDLPKDLNPQKGMTLYMNTPAGQLPVRVVKVRPTSITIDANHELAGQTLHFAVTVKEVRRATREELDHGHAHSPGHHHH